MSNFVNCNLCGEKQCKVLYKSKVDSDLLSESEFNCTSIGHGDFGQIVRCSKCGLVYRNPREEDKNLLCTYKNTVDYTYNYEAKGRYLTFKRLVEFVSLFANAGYLCDIGCYTGVYLDLARDSGWTVLGVEPSVWASDEARKKGLDIFTGSIEDMQYFNNNFDVITMWDVIEHLHDPLSSLKIIQHRLKKEGLLFFTTMKIDSMFVKCLGKNWPWFMKMHLYYFDSKTIVDMLKKCGFSVMCIKSYPHIVSMRYLVYKILHSMPFLKSLKDAYHKLSFVPNFCVPVDLGDFMLVVAKKI
jgi:2-polyprenyl-3-methyl-5-hydroxy-6-metoxy-1,4-benzoquinol methylase